MSVRWAVCRSGTELVSLTLDLREENKLGQLPQKLLCFDVRSSDSRSHRVVVGQAEQDADKDDVQQRDDVAELQFRRSVSDHLPRDSS
jgi:hypothetical protein